jgi:hypothetical protein
MLFTNKIDHGSPPGEPAFIDTAAARFEIPQSVPGIENHQLVGRRGGPTKIGEDQEYQAGYDPDAFHDEFLRCS